MMLVRLDPNSSTINVLSVPRDLKVQIPRAADGDRQAQLRPTRSAGPNLLIKILKQQVFPGLHVNHIIDVNFGGFADLVDAIGCVYTDVDHRYYNNTALTDYSSIDIQPGYQKLCGDRRAARSCASATPTPTSSATRASRTSSAGPRTSSAQTDLFNERDKLMKIFGAATPRPTTTCTRIDGLINLFNLVGSRPATRSSRSRSRRSCCRALRCADRDSVAPQTPVLRDRRSAGPSRRVPRVHDADARAPAPAPARRRTRQRRHGPHGGGAVGRPDRRRRRRQAQAAALGHVGMPVYYPKLIVAGLAVLHERRDQLPRRRSAPSPGRTRARTDPRPAAASPITRTG